MIDVFGERFMDHGLLEAEISMICKYKKIKLCELTFLIIWVLGHYGVMYRNEEGHEGVSTS
jgi:hypothetical protein